MWNHHTESIKKTLHHFWDLQGFQVFFNSWARHGAPKICMGQGMACSAAVSATEPGPANQRPSSWRLTNGLTFNQRLANFRCITHGVHRTNSRSKYKDIKWYQYTYKCVYEFSNNINGFCCLSRFFIWHLQVVHDVGFVLTIEHLDLSLLRHQRSLQKLRCFATFCQTKLLSSKLYLHCMYVYELNINVTLIYYIILYNMISYYTMHMDMEYRPMDNLRTNS